MAFEPSLSSSGNDSLYSHPASKISTTSKIIDEQSAPVEREGHLETLMEL